MAELAAPRAGSGLALAFLLVGIAALPLFAVASAPTTRAVAPGEDIQAAIDASSPGDTVLLLAGVHTQALEVGIPDLTIRGEGQGVTILDGADVGEDGIGVYADGVTVSDLTIQHFGGNGVYFEDVVGFLVERVSAVDNGPYGIYAIRSRAGTFRDSYASGHADSGFYLGQVASCECVIERVVAENNLIGYSGTGAGHIVIRDSLWQNNAAGIVPNVLPSEPELQTSLIILNNIVRDNNNYVASDTWHFTGFLHVPAGLGIVIAGGVDDLVTKNTVTGHDLAGIAVVFLFMEPSLNKVVGNALDNPGPDILWDEGGVNNCFEDNTRPDGSPATFSAGPIWGALGALPDCATPNAGVPSPVTLARLVSLVVFGCEPEEQPGGGCHLEPFI